VWDLDDTIVAIAAGGAGSWRGIVRISGSIAWQLSGRLFSHALPEPHPGFRPIAVPGEFTLPALHAPLPVTLYLSAAPRSYTGQDVVEVHTIDSPPLLALVVSALVAEGARQAAPGEFSMRAFLNGKLDLTQAEAIAGLIDASSSSQADAALRQLAGGIAGPIQTLRDRLLDLLAELEAGLDFAEEDLEFIDRTELDAVLCDAEQRLAELDERMHGRSLAIDRPRVILAGPPNAGKSSLYNALLGRSAAIVNAQAGTTRDFLTASLDVGQSTVELIDTAGIEHARDLIGQAVQRAREEACKSAHLVLWCEDFGPPSLPVACGPLAQLDGAPIVRVWTKCDLRSGSPEESSRHAPRDEPTKSVHPFGIGHITRSVMATSGACPAGQNEATNGGSDLRISVSATTGAGLDHLRLAIENWLHALDEGNGAIVASTAVRCHDSIAHALQAVRSARELARNRMSDELTAAELRAALDALAHVVGAVYTDDILDRIFSRFCVGK
jgi:tRNA modification GTPase